LEDVVEERSAIWSPLLVGARRHDLALDRNGAAVPPIERDAHAPAGERRAERVEGKTITSSGRNDEREEAERRLASQKRERL